MKKGILLNTIIILLELIGVSIAISRNGLVILGFYTLDSNILLLISCIFYEIWLLQNRKNENAILPERLKLFKYITTSLVFQTFIIVIFVLFPMELVMDPEFAIEILVGHSNLYLHLLCPIIAVITYIKFEKAENYGMRENIYALVPTLIYAGVTTVLNVLKVVRGPYPFLYVYEQPVYMSVFWGISIVLIAFILAYIIRRLNSKFGKPSM